MNFSRKKSSQSKQIHFASLRGEKERSFVLLTERSEV